MKEEIVASGSFKSEERKENTPAHIHDLSLRLFCALTLPRSIIIQLLVPFVNDVSHTWQQEIRREEGLISIGGTLLYGTQKKSLRGHILLI